MPIGRAIDTEHNTRVAELRERLPDSQFTFTFDRSSGPGGQNVNKVNTRVTLSLDFENSPLLTDFEKHQIRSKLSRRMSTGGVLRVISMKLRTQLGNRNAAVDRLFELLAETLKPTKRRHATRPTKSSKRRRLAEKKLTSERKSSRRHRAETD